MSRLAAGLLILSTALLGQTALAPGSRVLMDAHNCYPYDGRWADRIERALSAGTPLAIEQDLFWYTDKKSGKSWSVVSHGKPATGAEPIMREYFFERIRPIMENALREGNKGDWPLITLNLDFKSDEAAHHAAVWKLLGEYEGWLSTAERSAKPDQVTPIQAGPLLVLSGENGSQERDFRDIFPAGTKLRVFGAVKPNAIHATNYRRWWNNSWDAVEKGGQRKAGAWSEKDNARLQALVTAAHVGGLWIRFYTLNGNPPEDDKTKGWEPDYNFGSAEAAVLRWRAAAKAGVDYIATDHYEDLAAFLKELRSTTTSASVPSKAKSENAAPR
jgi:hypothetical protein